MRGKATVLQCGAVRCSALQCVAVWRGALQCVAVCFSMLQYAAVCCCVLLYCSMFKLNFFFLDFESTLDESTQSTGVDSCCEKSSFRRTTPPLCTFLI